MEENGDTDSHLWSSVISKENWDTFISLYSELQLARASVAQIECVCAEGDCPFDNPKHPDDKPAHLQHDSNNEYSLERLKKKNKGIKRWSVNRVSHATLPNHSQEERPKSLCIVDDLQPREVIKMKQKERVSRKNKTFSVGFRLTEHC